MLIWELDTVLAASSSRCVHQRSIPGVLVTDGDEASRSPGDDPVADDPVADGSVEGDPVADGPVEDGPVGEPASGAPPPRRRAGDQAAQQPPHPPIGPTRARPGRRPR